MVGGPKKNILTQTEALYIEFQQHPKVIALDVAGVLGKAKEGKANLDSFSTALENAKLPLPGLAKKQELDGHMLAMEKSCGQVQRYLTGFRALRTIGARLKLEGKRVYRTARDTIVRYLKDRDTPAAIAKLLADVIQSLDYSKQGKSFQFTYDPPLMKAGDHVDLSYWGVPRLLALEPDTDVPDLSKRVHAYIDANRTSIDEAKTKCLKDIIAKTRAVSSTTFTALAPLHGTTTLITHCLARLCLFARRLLRLSTVLLT